MTEHEKGMGGVKKLLCSVLSVTHMAELSQAHGTSILGMNPNCVYAGPKDCTQVAKVLSEAANHYTSTLAMPA